MTLLASKPDRIALIAGPLLVLALVVVFAGWTGDGPHAGGAAIWVLATSAPWALLWLAAAAGAGTWIRRWLVPGVRPAWVVDLGLGVTTMLWLDATLGRLGLLHAPMAWTLIAIGLGLLVLALRRSGDIRVASPPWIMWTAAPALAVLLLATTSAPGWLWATEFGGYDAMGYHLLLPREWLAGGRITGLEHNVYSFLPGYVEAAYLHLGVLRGDLISAAPACQMLHAVMTVATALGVGALAAKTVSDTQRASDTFGVATTLVLVTPWVVVVGSLAYNEMVVNLLLVAGLVVLLSTEDGWRRGVAVGLLAAAACGAKLTSAGFVAAPLVLLLAWGRPGRVRLLTLAAAACAGLVVLAPWLIGNTLATGNPVFPFLTGLLGTGHWTVEQAATWSHAHLSGVGGPASLWRQWLAFGLGPNPAPPEPWSPQWALLPWLGLVGLTVTLTRGEHRPLALRLAAVLGVQVLFWLLFTHLQSRFLLPTVVPLALAAAVGRAALTGGRIPRRITAPVAAAALLAMSVIPVIVFRSEPGGQPARMVDWTDARAGRRVAEANREVLATLWPDFHLRFRLPDARVLLVGEATPLYFPGGVTYQTTWDRGPLSAAMRVGDDPAAWMAALADEGYTHLLVRPEMLVRWADAGWNDPLLTVERVMSAADDHARLVAEFPMGVRLYAIEP